MTTLLAYVDKRQDGLATGEVVRDGEFFDFEVEDCEPDDVWGPIIGRILDDLGYDVGPDHYDGGVVSNHFTDVGVALLEINVTEVPSLYDYADADAEHTPDPESGYGDDVFDNCRTCGLAVTGDGKRHGTDEEVLATMWKDALALADRLDVVTPLIGLARTEVALTDENDCSTFHVVIAGGSDPVNVTMTPNMLRAALRAAALEQEA